MIEWEGGWDVFPTVCVEVINSRLAQSPGPPEGSAAEDKLFPYLFTDTSTQAHSLSFGHLPPTHSSHPGTKPNHAVLLYKDVLWWKFQTQAYHVTWGLLNCLSRPYAKSLGFGCLSLHVTHSHLPANLEKSSFLLIQMFSSTHIESFTPCLFLLSPPQGILFLSTVFFTS